MDFRIYDPILVIDCALCGQTEKNETSNCDFNGLLTKAEVSGAVAIGLYCEVGGVRIPTDSHLRGLYGNPELLRTQGGYPAWQCPEDKYYNGAPILFPNGTVSPRSSFFFVFFF